VNPMKTEDSQKIKKALLAISKFKYQEEKDGGNEFKKGMASVAETMLEIISGHGNSIEYRDAVRNLIQKSK